jgi:hypothetical protein
VITSTLLTLLVIPSFYDSVEIWRDKVLGLIARLRGGRAAGSDGGVINAK